MVSKLNPEYFTDSDGESFAYFTINEICGLLGCASQKAVAVLNELESKRLVEKKRVGLGKPTRLKVTHFALKMIETEKSDSENHNSEIVKKTIDNCENNNSEIVETTIQEFPESQGSKNNINKNNFSYTNPSVIYERTVKEIEEQIEIECINGDAEIVREIVMIMADVLTMPSPTVKISGIPLPHSVVAERYRLLRAEHIESIVFDISRCSKKILNMRSYMIALLYNAPTTFAVSEAAEYAYHTNKEA